MISLQMGSFFIILSDFFGTFTKKVRSLMIINVFGFSNKEKFNRHCCELSYNLYILKTGIPDSQWRVKLAIDGHSIYDMREHNMNTNY